LPKYGYVVLQRHRRNPGKFYHDALFLGCEAKPWVGSDWLVSSFKLQPCLELCRFAQAPLKTKVARWKAHFPLRVCEKTPVQHSSEWMVYYSRYATGKKGVALESRSYNKSHPSPKAYYFSEIDDQKSFLIV
jgi:hypothetical protein